MHINDLEVGQYYMFVFRFVEYEDIPVKLNAIHGQHDVKVSLLSLESIDIEHSISADPRSLRELTSDEYIKHIIKPATRNFGAKLYDLCNNIWQGIVSAFKSIWEGLVTFVTLVRCKVWDIHEIDWIPTWFYSDSDHEHYRVGFCKHCGKRVSLGEYDHDERLR